MKTFIVVEYSKSNTNVSRSVIEADDLLSAYQEMWASDYDLDDNDIMVLSQHVKYDDESLTLFGNDDMGNVIVVVEVVS